VDTDDGAIRSLGNLRSAECIAVVAGHLWHIKFTSGTSIDPTSPITAVNVTNLFRSQVSLNVIFVFTQVFTVFGNNCEQQSLISYNVERPLCG